MRFWHGDADRVVSVAMGRYLDQAIPHCRAEFIPGGGRYPVFDRIGACLNAMIQ